MKHDTKFVPHLPLQELKEFSVAVAQDLLETAKSGPDFLKKVITGDESCMALTLNKILVLSVKKSQLSPHPKKAQQNRSKFKAILTSVVQNAFAPQGKQLIKITTFKFFAKLKDVVRRSCGQLVTCCFPTIMRLPIFHTLYKVFWLNITSPRCHSLYIAHI